jgi:hypothetical protein
VITRKGRHVIDDTTGEKFSDAKTKRFAKKMTEVWRNVYKSNIFTPAEERVINRLADYLQLNTNALLNTDNSVMNIEDMARAIVMDRKDTRKYINSLVRKNALGIWKSGFSETYYMNPHLYVRGEIKRWLYSRFDEEVSVKLQIGQGLLMNGRHQISLISSSSE